jgi:Sap, sulfolipid-1-addressing protein
MLKLALAVVAIALPDCINPSLIGGELLVAIGSRPRGRTVAFTAAAFAVTFVFGVALALGLGDLILAFLPKPGRTVKYALITGAGVALVIGAVVIWLRRGSLARPSQDRGRPGGPPAVIGAGLAGLELLTAFPYFAAIALIVGSGASNAGKLALITLYCFVYTLPLIAIAGAFVVMGERAEDLMRPIGDWLLGHWPAIVGPITGAIGIALAILGTVQLASG